MPTRRNYTFAKTPAGADARSRIARIARALRRAPGTVYALLPIVDTDRVTILLYLDYLRGNLRAPRRFRVVDWQKCGGPPMAVYGPGCEPDAPKPEPQRPEEAARRKAERMARVRTEVRKVRAIAATATKPAEDDIETAMDIEASERAAALQPRRDAMIWALFGAPQ